MRGRVCVVACALLGFVLAVAGTATVEDHDLAVRAAYDDELEQTADEDGSSARERGLDDAMVRPGLVEAAEGVDDRLEASKKDLLSRGSKNGEGTGLERKGKMGSDKAEKEQGPERGSGPTSEDVVHSTKPDAENVSKDGLKRDSTTDSQSSLDKLSEKKKEIAASNSDQLSGRGNAQADALGEAAASNGRSKSDHGAQIVPRIETSPEEPTSLSAARDLADSDDASSFSIGPSGEAKSEDELSSTSSRSLDSDKKPTPGKESKSGKETKHGGEENGSTEMKSSKEVNEDKVPKVSARDGNDGDGAEGKISAKKAEVRKPEDAAERIKPAVQKIVNKPKPSKHPKPATEFVQLGEQRFEKSRVRSIGDIDGNGFIDYAIMFPKEGNSRGAIRVYLLQDGGAVIQTKHIVPGKWGFKEEPLQEGDHFGSSIASLGDINGDGVKDIAVGAPGDSEDGLRKGAIYILLMKKDGSVLSGQKISSSTDGSLDKQHVVNEGFGSKLMAMDDLNEDGIREIAVQSKDGTTTLVFLTRDGTSHAGVKVGAGIKAVVRSLSSSEIKSEHKDELKDDAKVDKVVVGGTVARMSKQIPIGALPSLAIRAADECIYNETHCACAETLGGHCYVFADTTTYRGRQVSLCDHAPCREAYKCSCDGMHICDLTNAVVRSYVSDGSAGDGRVYCHEEDTRVAMLRPSSRMGQAYGPMLNQVVRATVFNETHCTCSRRALVVEPTVCLDFHTQVAEEATICSKRPCHVSSSELVCDLSGEATCSRNDFERISYHDDGSTTDSSLVYCHAETHTVERVSCVASCDKL